MGAPVNHDATPKLPILEDEVVAWRNRRTQRQQATIGQVRVVRIHRRVPATSRQSDLAIRYPRVTT
jgi:hypothetical protein